MNVSSIVCITPGIHCAPEIAIAAVKAGEYGLLDLGYGVSLPVRGAAIKKLQNFVGKTTSWGVRWSLLERSNRHLKELQILLNRRFPCLLLADRWPQRPSLTKGLDRWRSVADRIWLEVTTPEEAKDAQEAGFDGVIVKGNEAGGRVGTETTYILLQRLHDSLRIPYWIQGGMGPDTFPAAILAGAAGCVLVEQLWLAQETPFCRVERGELSILDGSESVCVVHGKHTYRVHAYRNRSVLKTLGTRSAPQRDWEPLLYQLLSFSSGERDLSDGKIQFIGQDIGLAAFLAKRFQTVGGILNGYRRARIENIDNAKSQEALAPHGEMSKRIGTVYPVVQGPMTGVSDVPGFCRSVAVAGAVPFIALGLASAAKARALLEKTREALCDRPWGVGLIGFAPATLRRNQFEVVCEIHPPFALIAGGRPDQAAGLEKAGIRTFLHVPSPGLLNSFLEQGARRFVFEGHECGGHVGPRTSFTLWQQAVGTLLSVKVKNEEAIEVLFAGGIHDALSGAMASVIAAPLIHQGIGFGVLIGTAYLCTVEAVEDGAILPEYQSRVFTCRKTTLVESSGGHVIRCAPTPFIREFDKRRRQLLTSGLNSTEIRRELELLNLGRLRTAAKGIMQKASSEKTVEVDRRTQRNQGLYLMGQVASLRDKAIPIKTLHEDICDGGVKLLTKKAKIRSRRCNRKSDGGDLAIIGMSCIFPDAPDIRRYWENICQNVQSFREIPAERFDADTFYSPDRLARDKFYSRWGSFLNERRFDPLQYWIPPASLYSIDPIQLYSLEVAGQALRDASYGRADFPHKRTGVFFSGAGFCDVGLGYIFRTMMRHYLGRADSIGMELRSEIIAGLDKHLPEWTEDTFPGLLSNVIAGRIANCFDLQGTNYVVDAACASSFAALYTAIRELRSGNCDAALVGAADATNNPTGFMCFASTQALTPQDITRPFDDKADGIMLGEGVAAIVLKRLPDAERDGDRIHAVIKGIGSSSDGRNRSLTAPYAPGQVEALKRAYADAGVDPATVSLIEAHATGTAVGDRVEIQALQDVFHHDLENIQSCAVGSVKSNIGHTKTAAGLAGLIKTVLALKHGVLPPTAGVQKPNRQLYAQPNSFYINTIIRPWIRHRGRPRRAGVNSFGFGGVNFHAVLEEPPPDLNQARTQNLCPRSVEVFAWSRGTHTEILDEMEALSEKIRTVAEDDIAELAGAVCHEETGRVESSQGLGPCRLAFVASSLSDLRRKVEIVRSRLTEKEFVHPTGIYYLESSPVKPNQIAFLFPGQGAQHLGMLKDLLLADSWGLSLFDQANNWLQGNFDRPLSDFIYPEPAFTEEACKKDEKRLEDTRIAQPALGVVELFAYDLLSRYGLRPGSVAGHSYGEYTALCAANVLSREDFIKISAVRGLVVHESTTACPGAMAAVMADVRKVAGVLRDTGVPVSIANLNAPTQTVVSGPVKDVEKLVDTFASHGLRARMISVSAAFHSPLLRTAAEQLHEALSQVRFGQAEIPVYSNTIAEPYPAQSAAKVVLLARHLEEPVLFERQIRRMYRDGARLFIECGPRNILSRLVGDILGDRSHGALALETPGTPIWQSFARLLAQVYVRGAPVHLASWFEERGLPRRPLDDILAEYEKKRRGKSTDWILYPSGSHPVAAEPFAGKAERKTEWVEKSTIQKKITQFWSDQLLPPPLPLPALEPLEGIPPGAVVPLPPNVTREPTRGASPQPQSPDPEEGNDTPDMGFLPSTDEFKRDLLQAVSECTGYPCDILDLDLQLEAELGIDSIKTLEIYSRLKRYHPSLRAADEYDEEALTAFARLKTLGDVIAAYDSNTKERQTIGSEKIEAETQKQTKLAASVKRYRLEAVQAPIAEDGRKGTLGRGQVVLVCGDVRYLTDAVLKVLAEQNVRTVHLLPGEQTRRLDDRRYCVNFTDAGSLPALHKEITGSRVKKIDGLINMLGLMPPFDESGVDAGGDGLELCQWILDLVKEFEVDLRSSSKSNHGWLVNLTSMDGRFGLDDPEKIPLAQAGTLGMFKTIAREWSGVSVKNIDLGTRMDPLAAASRIILECRTKDNRREIGLDDFGRWTPELFEKPLIPGESQELGLDEYSVILITGGATGITAEAAKWLAQYRAPKLIILGRSPLPGREEDITSTLEDAASLRRALVEQARKCSGTVIPADIDARIRRILKDREIRANLDMMRTSGATVEYHSLDVRDNEKLCRLIDAVYDKYGRLDGVIHGAGTIEDRFIKDKTPESFARIFSTKVSPARILMQKIRPESLQFMIFYSSIAARFGNPGQIDYSAANEYLNKLSLLLNKRWPGKVVAINWGPWNFGGMVSQPLRQICEERGINLITPEEGNRLLKNELCATPDGSPEIVISCDHLLHLAETDSMGVLSELYKYSRRQGRQTTRMIES